MDATRQQTFGELIRSYRRRAGLTQEELAERAELSPRGLLYLERDERHPLPGTVRRLADALGLEGNDRPDFLAAGERANARESNLPSSRETVAVDGLPVQLTPFVGRERERGEVGTLLHDQSVRLLTLTGPGGTGKTRLAIEAAREVLAQSRDGVYFVSLGPVADTASVVPAVCRAIGMTEGMGEFSLLSLKAQLRDRQILLVLDTFEHLLPAATTLADLLATCPRLRMLVTSRAPLHLSAEHQFAVPPMDLPLSTEATPEDIDHSDATRLFVLRAQATDSHFVITPQNAPSIAAICARLDGLPLAIELAAARVAVLPLPALQDRLSNRLQLLSRGARDAPPRQQTIRAAIDWSYRLLGEKEQRLLSRLAVFVGGWILEAAEEICAPGHETALIESGCALDQEFGVLEALSSLVESSLVRVVEGESGEPRYYMLDTISEFASEKLRQSGEAEVIAGRHAEFYVRLAERVDPPHPWIRPPESSILGNYRLIEQEHGNFVAALAWLREHDEGIQGLRLLGALWVVWAEHFHRHDLKVWLRDFEPYLEQAPPAVHARGLLAHSTTRDASDVQALEEAIALYRTVDDDLVRLRGLVAAASGLVYFAPQPQSMPYLPDLFEETLLLARDLGSSWAEAASLRALGSIALNWHNDRARAEQLWGESLKVDRLAGNSVGASDTLWTLTWLAAEDGDLVTARDYLAEQTRAMHDMSNESRLVTVRLGTAVVELLEGNHAAVAEILHDVGSQARFQTVSASDDWLGKLVMIVYIAASLASARAEATRAARLYGAVDGLVHAPSEYVVAYYMFVGECESFRVAARAELDEAAWLAAWEEGQAMTTDEAVAYAVSESGQ